MWLSLEGLSNYLHISKASSYRLLRNKHLPKHRLGKLWRFDSDEIDNFIKTSPDTKPKPYRKTKKS